MHELALADGGASLHSRNVVGALAEIQARHTGGYGAGGDDEVFVFREVELVDHTAKQVDIDLPSRGNETGADFDDHAHRNNFCWPDSPFICLWQRPGWDQPAPRRGGTIVISCR